MRLDLLVVATLCGAPVVALAEDCNNNGVADADEIAADPSIDCDGNGVIDSCEIAARDCNGNGRIDACDIADGLVLDSDGNGVPDMCELPPGSYVLFDESGVPLPDGSAEVSYAPGSAALVVHLNSIILELKARLSDAAAAASSETNPALWSDRDAQIAELVTEIQQLQLMIDQIQRTLSNLDEAMHDSATELLKGLAYGSGHGYNADVGALEVGNWTLPEGGAQGQAWVRFALADGAHLLMNRSDELLSLSVGSNATLVIPGSTNVSLLGLSSRGKGDSLVNNGLVQLGVGGVGATLTASGTIDNASGVVLAHAGALDLDGELTGGTVRIEIATVRGGAKAMLDGVTLEMAGGELLVPARLSGASVWSAGEIRCGTMTLEGAEIQFVNGGSKRLNATNLECSGTLRLEATDYPLAMTGGAAGQTFSLTILADGELEFGPNTQVFGSGLATYELVNLGQMRLLGNASTSGDAGFRVENRGSVVIGEHQLSINHIYEQFAGQTVLENGAITGGGGLCRFYGGKLIGQGAVLQPVFIGDATVRPGSPIGQLGLARGCQFDEGSTLVVEIGGPTPVSEHDIVSISGGGAVLAGKLVATLASGFQPSEGDAFVVVQSQNPLAGSFDEIALPPLRPGLLWEVDQQIHDVVLRVVGARRQVQMQTLR